MDKGFVEAIAELAKKGFTVEQDGKTFAPFGMQVVADDPRPSKVGLTTLIGFVDFLKRNVDGVTLDEYVVIVESPLVVALVSAFGGPFAQRTRLLEAAIKDPTEDFFGHFISAETFIITLGSLFMPTDDREALLALVGNIDSEETIKQQDDGITQRVTVKKGLSGALMDEVCSPKIVMLQPFRTFPEIHQPVSPFLFRMKGEEGKGVFCALFEADNGMWELKAKLNIREFVLGELPGLTVVV